MSTEVVHGPQPQFTATLQPDGSYHVVITGHYTTQDGLAAAGVTEVVWQSDRPVKRQAELLALRSAFIGWFIEMCLVHGYTWAQAVGALKSYPFPKVRAAAKGHPNPLVSKWAKEPTAAQLARMAKRERTEPPVREPNG
jgi:hypothetical protein